MLSSHDQDKSSPKSHPIEIIASGNITEINLFDFKKDVPVADSQRGLISELKIQLFKQMYLQL
jgi:hypothetical protein